MAVLNRLQTLSAIEPPESSAAHTANVLSLDAAEWLSGSSPSITQLRGQIRRVAPYFRTALLTGERGCGDAAAAHMLHQLSPLTQRPFVELTPAEAELRLGFENTPLSLAAEGMLYLPQPERLSRRSQLVLVRLLREHGSRAPRIVAFSERGLRSLVSSGGFSAELADSLGALRITVPPLRERGEDIPELLTHAIHTLSAHQGRTPPQLSPDLLEAAVKFPWPNNFIQMQAAAEALLEKIDRMERSGYSSLQTSALQTSTLRTQTLRAEDLKAVLGAIPEPLPRERREIRLARLDDVVHEHIRSVLFACNGNKLRTAEVLGISRSTLYRMLESRMIETQGAHAPLPASRQNLQMAG